MILELGGEDTPIRRARLDEFERQVAQKLSVWQTLWLVVKVLWLVLVSLVRRPATSETLHIDINDGRSSVRIERDGVAS